MRSTAFYASHLEPLLPPTCNLAKNRGLFPKHLQAVKRVRNTVMGNIQINEGVLSTTAPLGLERHLEQCSGGVAPAPKRHRITRRLPIQKKTRSSARPSAGYKNKRAGKRNMMDETERKALIESDCWAGDVTAVSVECKGCGKTVSLDKRSMYYPGLWIKHRSKCPGIRRLEGRTGKLEDGRREKLPKKARKIVKLGGSDRSSSGSLLSDEDVMHEVDFGCKMRSDLPSSSQSIQADFGMGAGLGGTDPIYKNENVYRGSHRSLQSVGVRVSEDSRTRDSLSMERAGSAVVSDVNGGRYWSSAPFAPEPAVPQLSESGRPLYRYSTRYELATSFRETTNVTSEDVDLWSDDVMEAAHCLASLSRA